MCLQWLVISIGKAQKRALRLERELPLMKLSSGRRASPEPREHGPSSSRSVPEVGARHVQISAVEFGRSGSCHVTDTQHKQW